MTQPTMKLGPLDWLVSGVTVALGVALLAAPIALTGGLSSLYALYGLMDDASLLSRLMLTPWLSPLMAIIPISLSIYCTVTAMRPRRRRVLLLIALALGLLATALFLRGLFTPILSAMGGVT